MTLLNPKFPAISIQHNLTPVKTNRHMQESSRPKYEWGQMVVKAVQRLQGADEVRMNIYNIHASPSTQQHWIKRAFADTVLGRKGTHEIRFRITGPKGNDSRSGASMFVRLEKKERKGKN